MSLIQAPVNTTGLSASLSDILEPTWKRDLGAFVFLWLSCFSQWAPNRNFLTWHAAPNTNEKLGSTKQPVARKNITCHIGCISYLKKGNLRKEGYNWSHSLWASHYGVEIIEAGTWSSWSYSFCSQELTLFFPFYSIQDASLWIHIWSKSYQFN